MLVVGSNVRNEAPIIAHRLRKAALNGAKVSFANSKVYEYFFDTADYMSGAGLVELLAGVAVAAGTTSGAISDICSGVTANDAQQRIAASLKDSDDALILLGAIAGKSCGVFRPACSCICDIGCYRREAWVYYEWPEHRRCATRRRIAASRHWWREQGYSRAGRCCHAGQRP